ncbi:P-loop NTPase fold protein [Microbacterium maritypicum]|uniref:KAP NTPase domain-containing protein n=1 Tax=Microbacterium maritypicum TaxID=33918 RepID=A0A4Y4B2T9_MICMQ|nr:P-loop NTPase fold protein [Microbacterium liquefaciens]GEC74676.1 hypothetical protein MLI01_08210 [Microbacterium liquefaciens]GGV51870.1 hypothetical protein GCM10010213_07520 [Microbacterium liquefaciens]
MTDSATLRLWDDNPSLDDFLGFDAVVDPIVKAIGTANVDPLAIGVHSPWGGGKSTVLNLLESLGSRGAVRRHTNGSLAVRQPR